MAVFTRRRPPLGLPGEMNQSVLDSSSSPLNTFQFRKPLLLGARYYNKFWSQVPKAPIHDKPCKLAKTFKTLRLHVLVHALNKQGRVNYACT